MPEPPPPPHADPWAEDHEPTPFQAAVVEVVTSLRPGDLLSYAEVAEQLGRPGAAQAVANVLRRAPGLPWWRVVPGDGVVYRSHRSTQLPLLRAEGHDVGDDGRLA